MNTDNDYLGNPSDILVTTHVLEEDLRDVIALEFKDFWHPKLRITPNELVITGSTVSTEHHDRPVSYPSQHHLVSHLRHQSIITRADNPEHTTGASECVLQLPHDSYPTLTVRLRQ